MREKLDTLLVFLGIGTLGAGAIATHIWVFMLTAPIILPILGALLGIMLILQLGEWLLMLITYFYLKFTGKWDPMIEKIKEEDRMRRQRK